MAALLLIAFLVFCGVVSVKYDSKYFIFITILALSGLYVFLEPTINFDLFRHYEIYDYVSKCSWREIFNINRDYNMSYSALLYNIYTETSPIYIMYIFILSRVAGKKLLIFVTTMIVYGIPMSIIYSIGKKFKLSNLNINISVIFLLLCINYLDVSGIRNILAISIVLLGLFWDLFERKKRILACALYVIGVLLHNSVIILVMLRMILLIKNKFWRRFSIILVIGAIPISVIAYKSGVYITGNGFVSNLFNSILEKLYNFVIGNGGSTYIRSLGFGTIVFNYVSRGIGIVAAFLICDKKGLNNKNSFCHEITLKIENYRYFLTLLFVFSLSCLVQYDMFVRINMFIIIVSAPLLPFGFSKFQTCRLGVLKRNNLIRGLFVYGFMITDLLIYYLISYRALDGLYMWGI